MTGETVRPWQGLSCVCSGYTWLAVNRTGQSVVVVVVVVGPLPYIAWITSDSYTGVGSEWSSHCHCLDYNWEFHRSYPVSCVTASGLP